MNSQKPSTIDEFISAYPEDMQVILQKIRQTIKQVAPEAQEKISYGMPTFTLNGKNLIHFNAYAHHIGLYPGPTAIEAFKEALKPYKTSKGTIQLPLSHPVPYDLIKKITQHCVGLRLKP